MDKIARLWFNLWKGNKLALFPMRQYLLTTRSLRSLDEHRLFALPTMEKQKVLPFGELHMRGFFTRERDDSFSPASRGTEMSVSVRVGLPGHSLGEGRSVAKKIMPFVIFLNGNIVSSNHPLIVKELQTTEPMNSNSRDTGSSTVLEE
jgi:hypothetical protein